MNVEQKMETNFYLKIAKGLWKIALNSLLCLWLTKL